MFFQVLTPGSQNEETVLSPSFLEMNTDGIKSELLYIRDKCGHRKELGEILYVHKIIAL